jgi:uncharacterized C2H2 Zn-finger protein
MATKTTAKLPCPECGKPFLLPNGLALHRRAAHGVKSKAQKAEEKRAKKRALKGETNGATQTEITVTKTRGKITTQPATIEAVADPTATQGINQAEANTLVTIGRLTQLCEDAARFYGTPAREFTQRCAALFYASQIR